MKTWSVLFVLEFEQRLETMNRERKSDKERRKKKIKMPFRLQDKKREIGVSHSHPIGPK